MTSPRRVIISKDDVPLAKAAGAEITYVGGGRWGKRAQVSGFIATLMIVVKRAARKRGTDPVNIMKWLNELGQLRVAGTVAGGGAVEASEFAPIVAEVLGARITIGPIRCYPSGDIEIENGRGSWQPATDELLQALDASRMMSSSPETIAEGAARVVLDWKQKAGR